MQKQGDLSDTDSSHNLIQKQADLSQMGLNWHLVQKQADLSEDSNNHLMQKQEGRACGCSDCML